MLYKCAVQHFELGIGSKFINYVHRYLMTAHPFGAPCVREPPMTPLVLIIHICFLYKCLFVFTWNIC